MNITVEQAFLAIHGMMHDVEDGDLKVQPHQQEQFEEDLDNAHTSLAGMAGVGPRVIDFNSPEVIQQNINNMLMMPAGQWHLQNVIENNITGCDKCDIQFETNDEDYVYTAITMSDCWDRALFADDSITTFISLAKKVKEGVFGTHAIDSICEVKDYDTDVDEEGFKANFEEYYFDRLDSVMSFLNACKEDEELAEIKQNIIENSGATILNGYPLHKYILTLLDNEEARIEHLILAQLNGARLVGEEDQVEGWARDLVSNLEIAEQTGNSLIFLDPFENPIDTDSKTVQKVVDKVFS